MAAPLCSTFLNATSAPDFPADISAFAPHRRRDGFAEKTLGVDGLAAVKADGREEEEEEDFPRSVLDGPLAEFSILPPPDMTVRERREQVVKIRIANPYVDNLEKMREISRRSRRRRRPTTSSHVEDQSSQSRLSSLKDGDSSVGTALDVVRTVDQIIRKTALLHHIKMTGEKKLYWNTSGVADLLCPHKIDKDIQQLELVESRLQNLMLHIPKIAVDLQKPPAPSLRLDPRSHETASKVLGDSGLKLVTEVANAAEKVELFVRSTSGTASTTALTRELARESEQTLNIVALVISTLSSASEN